MTQALSQALSCVISVFASFVNMIFNMSYPAMTISFGAVLLGIILVDIGFSYLDFFAKKDGMDSMRYKE